MPTPVSVLATAPPFVERCRGDSNTMIDDRASLSLPAA
jgi:hypothetical protein